MQEKNKLILVPVDNLTTTYCFFIWVGPAHMLFSIFFRWRVFIGATPNTRHVYLFTYENQTPFVISFKTFIKSI